MKYFVNYENSTGKIIKISSCDLGNMKEINFPNDFDFMKANAKEVYSFKIDGDVAVKIGEDEQKILYPFLFPPSEKSDAEKQNDQLTEMIKASSTKTYLNNLADEQASLIPFCYDAWDDFNEGFSFEKDTRIQSTGKLFKAKNTVLKTQLRPENDPDNFDDLTGNQSTGSEDDVITLPDNVMTQGYSYVYGKFYKKNDNDKVYQCYRGGLSEEVANSMFGQVIVLYFYPDALLGSYFREKV